MTPLMYWAGGLAMRYHNSEREPDVLLVVEHGQKDGMAGFYVRVRRTNVVTWERWRRTDPAAGELFEKAVEQHESGGDMGELL